VETQVKNDRGEYISLSANDEEQDINIIDLNMTFAEFINNFRDKQGRTIYKEELERAIRERRHMVIINYKDLKKFNEALAKQFEKDPEGTIESISRYLLVNVIEDKDKEFARNEGKDFMVGITGYEDRIITPSQKKIDYLNKLITVEGIVSAIGEKKQHVLIRGVIYYYLENGELKTYGPIQFKQDYLSEEEIYDKFCGYCKKRPSKVEFSDYDSVVTNRTIAILQDKPERMKGGQTSPGSLILVLTREFADALNPGDVVKVTGFLRTRRLEDGAKNTENFYFVVTGVEHEQVPYSDIILTTDDLMEIEGLRKNPKKLMRDFIDSIAPTVYGLEKIKEAIALSLVGGTEVVLPDGNVRGDIHLLIIGEPGTGKTRLLKAIQKIAPKSIYATAETSTKVGLSAGLERDENTGEWMIQAGALALADRGVLLLDEIDKLNPQDRVALREAMELQTVSVTKIKKTRLNTRVSLIAVGNPKGDRFSRGNIYQYIDMDISLLSRFDLIFAVREQLDANKIKFILESTVKTNKTTLNNFMYNPPIDEKMLKKIIVYARTKIFPVFSEEAYNELLQAATYLTGLSDKLPELKKLLSGREPHTLRRLATAYARLQLKEVVDVEDVKMAYDLLLESLSSLGIMGKSEDEDET